MKQRELQQREELLEGSEEALEKRRAQHATNAVKTAEAATQGLRELRGVLVRQNQMAVANKSALGALVVCLTDQLKASKS